MVQRRICGGCNSASSTQVMSVVAPTIDSGTGRSPPSGWPGNALSQTARHRHQDQNARDKTRHDEARDQWMAAQRLNKVIFLVFAPRAAAQTFPLELRSTKCFEHE